MSVHRKRENNFLHWIEWSHLKVAIETPPMDCEGKRNCKMAARQTLALLSLPDLKTSSVVQTQLTFRAGELTNLANIS